jgi:hypothetical protein
MPFESATKRFGLLAARLSACSWRGWREVLELLRLADGLPLRLPCGGLPAGGALPCRCPRLSLGARARWQSVRAPGPPVEGPEYCWRVPVGPWLWISPRDSVPLSAARWTLPKACFPGLLEVIDAGADGGDSVTDLMAAGVPALRLVSTGLACPAPEGWDSPDPPAAAECGS